MKKKTYEQIMKTSVSNRGQGFDNASQIEGQSSPGGVKKCLRPPLVRQVPTSTQCQAFLCLMNVCGHSFLCLVNESKELTELKELNE